MVKLKDFSYVPAKTSVKTKGGKRKNIATYLGGDNESLTLYVNRVILEK